jgi:hypothetical protein
VPHAYCLAPNADAECRMTKCPHAFLAAREICCAREEVLGEDRTTQQPTSNNKQHTQQAVNQKTNGILMSVLLQKAASPAPPMPQ